jgi:hypothetical protein
MSVDTKAPKVLAHLRLSNETSRRYQEHLEKNAQVAEAVKAAVPEAVQALVDNERIFGHQTEEVTEKIASSHEACIELIRDLAKHRNAVEIESIGSQVGQEKKASARSVTGAQIADYDEDPAGAAFRERLMGTR